MTSAWMGRIQGDSVDRSRTAWRSECLRVKQLVRQTRELRCVIPVFRQILDREGLQKH